MVRTCGITEEHSRRILKKAVLFCVVCLVHLVSLVYPVSLVQPNKRDKPNRPNNGLLTLEDFFSILLVGRHGALGINHQ